MAPEQAAGKSGASRRRWTCTACSPPGPILYEALTGRPPFAAATVDATLGLVRQDEPVPPRRLQPTVPRDLETICLKCLRKEAGRRYATAQDLADDLRRFRAGEPIRARPVGMPERVVGWCRRNPGVAGLLAALVLVFLAGLSGVLWQWQRASRNAAEAQQNATAFRRERDAARQEKERAERNLQMVRHRVDKLNLLGRKLLQRRGLYRTGQAVLEEALAFYQQMLPEEGNDPEVRREAAKMFLQVAEIHYALGQAGKAAEAFDRQARLLSSLLEEDPTSKDLRIALADSRRWRGNALRELGKAREARQAYDQAAALHQALLKESPDEALYKAALANTLLNTATLLSRRDQAEELEPLHHRVLKLNREAVRSRPNELRFQVELALSLEEQGLFFLETGRGAQVEAVIREALAIHEKVVARGRRHGANEAFVARSAVSLGRVLAAAGRAREAEESYRKAVKLLDGMVKQFPESALRRTELAQALAGLADLLKGPDCRSEVEAVRRRVILHYEALKGNFQEDPQHQRNLLRGYLELVSLLYKLDRQCEAVEPFRKALELDPKNPDINNELAWFLATSPEPRLRDGALAVQLAKKAVAARPKSGNYRNTLGAAHFCNGDDKAAVAELEASMRLRAGGDSFDWFFLAMAHCRLGDRDKAQTWFDRAVQWLDRRKPPDDELRRFARRRKLCWPKRASVEPCRTRPSAVRISAWIGRRAAEPWPASTSISRAPGFEVPRAPARSRPE